jgi:hypothetical protein
MNVALEGMPYLQRKESEHTASSYACSEDGGCNNIYIYIYIISLFFIRLIGNMMYGIEAFGDYSLDNVGCIFRVILGR